METEQQAEELRQALERLLRVVKERATEDTATGLIRESEQEVHRVVVTAFEYDEDGTIRPKTYREPILKKTFWVRDSVEVVKNSAEFSEALSKLNTIKAQSGSNEIQLEFLVQTLLKTYLEDPQEIESVITSFLKAATGQPIAQKIRLEVTGLGVPEEEIEFDDHGTTVKIRRTTIQDLEKTITPLELTDRPRCPSAILEMQFQSSAGDSSLADRKIGQALAILRLFKLAEVKHLRYETHSEAMQSPRSRITIISRDESEPIKKAAITPSEASCLPGFWVNLSSTIAEALYSNDTTRSHIRIAYSRYCEALKSYPDFERSIALAVMGLESLFLAKSERQELVYRLALRVARALGGLGQDPRETYRVMKQAYTIRNIFVHGAMLTKKDKKKIRRKFGEEQAIRDLVLDYLRRSIILMTLSDKEKEHIIRLIDDSLVTGNEAELEAVARGARELLSRCS